MFDAVKKLDQTEQVGAVEIYLFPSKNGRLNRS